MPKRRMNSYKGKGKTKIPEDVKTGRLTKPGYKYYGTRGISDALRSAK